MKRVLRSNTATPTFFAGTAVITFIAVLGLSAVPTEPAAEADLLVVPREKRVVLNSSFEVTIVAESNVPVNVFAGQLRFNQNVLRIQSIDYNTSVADLWTEEPWYSNGEGTVTFAGGTTQIGGFEGSKGLLTVTFQAVQPGRGEVTLHGKRILLHDGLGTDAELEDPIRAVFTVDPTNTAASSATAEDIASFEIVSGPPTTDLNGDGRQTIADVSIFMLHIAGNEYRYDFDLDGHVGIRDLNILLGL